MQCSCDSLAEPSDPTTWCAVCRGAAGGDLEFWSAPLGEPVELSADRAKEIAAGFRESTQRVVRSMLVLDPPPDRKAIEDFRKGMRAATADVRGHTIEVAPPEGPYEVLLAIEGQTTADLDGNPILYYDATAIRGMAGELPGGRIEVRERDDGRLQAVMVLGQPDTRQARSADAERDRLVEAFHALHLKLCQRHAIPSDGRGSRSAVARLLGITPQQYGDALRGHRGSVGTLCRWANAAGFLAEVPDEGPITFRRARA